MLPYFGSRSHKVHSSSMKIHGYTVFFNNVNVLGENQKFKGIYRAQRLCLLLIGFCPLLLAGWIALSRVVDNHHFPSDVVGGSILGLLVAFVVFYIHYLPSCQPHRFSTNGDSSQYKQFHNNGNNDESILNALSSSNAL